MDQTEAQLAELEDRAIPLLAGGRADLAVADDLEELLRRDFRHHPWARLVVAAGLLDLRDDRVDEVLSSSLRSFRRRGDGRGLGYAEYVSGGLALFRGDLQAAAVWYQRSRLHLGLDCPIDAPALTLIGLAAYQRGELNEAVAMTEEALATARMRGARSFEGMAGLYLAYFLLEQGFFSRAESLLKAAEETLRELADPAERRDLPLVLACQGVLATLRGRDDDAEEHFDSALLAATALRLPPTVGMVLVVRGEFTARRNALRSVADARRGLELLAGDAWWQSWGLRAHGVAARETGDLATSCKILQRLVEGQLSPLERGLTLLALGETLLRTNDPGSATSSLEEALGLLHAIGARYWVARCWVALSEAGPPRAQRRKRAHLLADDDEAYRLLLVGRSTLRIKVLGNAGVWLGGERVNFTTRKAELAIFCLALAVPVGLHAEVLIERLWPGAPADCVHGRLRTALWQMRKALGVEAWRLERKGELISLQVDVACLDLGQVRSSAKALLKDVDDQFDVHAARLALAQLSQRLLPSWQYEPWVEAETARNAELVARLAERLKPR